MNPQAEKTASQDKVHLTPVEEQFILHWGEMGPRWGVNRTVAQTHALLYLSEKPLHAEQIAATLSVARSNVSTCIRELLSWGIIRQVPILGERKDHFESLHDVWEMFMIVSEERRKRELDPTLMMLRECSQTLESNKSTNKVLRERIGNMLDFFETMAVCHQQTRDVPVEKLVSLLKTKNWLQNLFKLKK